MTRQRRVILDALQSARSHPSADQLYIQVRRQLPRISLGTVYRNLEILSRLGHVLRLRPADGGQMRFDGDLSRHYHVQCVRCGKVDDLVLRPLTGLHRQAARACGYRIVDHQLDLLGVCPQCGRGDEHAANGSRPKRRRVAHGRNKQRDDLRTTRSDETCKR